MPTPYLPDDNGCIAVPQPLVRVVVVVYIALLMTVATALLVRLIGWGPQGAAAVAALLAATTAALRTTPARPER